MVTKINGEILTKTTKIVIPSFNNFTISFPLWKQPIHKKSPQLQKRTHLFRKTYSHKNFIGIL